MLAGLIGVNRDIHSVYVMLIPLTTGRLESRGDRRNRTRQHRQRCIGEPGRVRRDAADRRPRLGEYPDREGGISLPRGAVEAGIDGASLELSEDEYEAMSAIAPGD